MRTLIAILILAATMACAEDVDVSYSKSIVIDGVDVHQIVMVIARDRAEVRVGMFPTKAGAKLEWPDRGEAVRVFAFPLDTVMAEYGKQSGTPPRSLGRLA